MINIFRKMPFRYKIVLFSSGITFAALIALYFISNSLFSSAFMEASTNQAISAQELTNQNLNLLLERSETYIRLLSINTDLQDTLNSNSADLKNGTLVNPRFSQSLSDATSGAFAPSANVLGCIIYLDGKIIYPQNSIPDRDVDNIFTEEYLAEINRSAAPAWKSSLSQIFYVKNNVAFHSYSSAENHYVISLSKQIVDRTNGRNLGVISLLLEEKSFSSLYDTDSSNYYLINQDNLIVSSADKELLNASVFNTLPITEDELDILRKTSSSTLIIDGKQYLVTLVHNKALNWDLIAFTDLSTFINKRSSVARLLLMVLFFTLAITFLVIWGSASAITKPIYTMLNVMRAYDGSIPALRAPDTLKGEMRVLGIGFNQLLDKIEHNVEEIEEIQKQKRKYELRILQEQIQPHFLYNALQTAASLVQLGHYEKSIKHLYALSDFYRLSLSEGKDIISLKDELKIVEDYLIIQHIRYINVFDYSIETNQTSLDLLIPKLSLQPLVENAIYHGLKPKKKKGSILIMAYQTDNTVTIEITDTGVGMTTEQIADVLTHNKEGSYGIRSVIDRLALIYENNFRFNIDSKKGEYTSVVIEIDCMFTEKELM